MDSLDIETAPLGPFAPAASGVRRWLRSAWVLSAGWASLAIVLTLSTLLALVTFRLGSSRYFHRVARLSGRLVLRISGVRVRVRHRERLRGRRMRLVALNHTSQLDMFVIASLIPPGGTALAKKEMLRVPFIGWAIFAFDVPTVDRSNPTRARQSLAEAAEKLRSRKATVFIAPEGTRSRSGRLGPFKMGLFHLAAQTRAPIIPAVVRGAKECQPMGTLVPRPGLVEVDLLEEIASDDFDDANLHDKRDALRRVFAEALDETEDVTTTP